MSEHIRRYPYRVTLSYRSMGSEILDDGDQRVANCAALLAKRAGTAVHTRFTYSLSVMATGRGPGAAWWVAKAVTRRAAAEAALPNWPLVRVEITRPSWKPRLKHSYYPRQTDARDAARESTSEGSEWLVTIERQRPSRGVSVAPSDKRLVEFALLLTGRGGTVESWGDHYSVSVWIEDASPRAALSWAFISTMQAIVKAGLPQWPVLRVEVVEAVEFWRS